MIDSIKAKLVVKKASDKGMAAERRIQLVPMEQLAEAVEDDDVWIGKTDPVARRKRQNRLNQRAYRKRKAAEYWSIALRPNNQQPHVFHADDRNQVSEPSSSAALSRFQVKSLPLIPYLTTADQTVVIFPLPLDHLLTLVQYNVLRATIANFELLSLNHIMPAECGAAWAIPPLDAVVPRNIPPNLEPTPVQLSTPHEPWIDALPSGQFRNNLIVATNDPLFDQDDFCADLVAGLFEGYGDNELRAIVAWSDPWHPRGWEVTEGFLSKWGYLLRGCGDMLESTNQWRAMRHEDALIWEV